MWIWKEPIEARNYILAADCSEGVGEIGDNSCFQIIDENNLEQVAEFYSNNVPPHIFAQIVHQMGVFYNNALVIVENMSVGGTVLSALQFDLGYENIYCESKGKQQVAGIKTGKQNRPAFLETLQNRLLNGAVKINSTRFVNELKTFEYNSISKKPEARRKKHDDAIMAMSMALYVRDSLIRGAPLGEAAEMSKVLKSDLFEQIKKEIMADNEDFFEKQNYRMILDDDGLPSNLDRKRDKNEILRSFAW